MVAVVKSSRIEGLTDTNSMPKWWSTDRWRNQYPEEINVTCDFDMDTLRATPEDAEMRYCPPYAAARKTGRPKKDKRIKSPLEGKKKRKKSIESPQEARTKDNEGEGEGKQGMRKQGKTGKRKSAD